MQAPATDRLRAWRLAAFWFGIQAVWGAVLGISLQSRSTLLAGHDVLAVFAEISTLGALAAAVVQLLVGPYSDAMRRRGDRRAMFYIVGAVGASVAALWFYRAESVAQLLVSYIALQAFMNVAIGPYQAVVPDFVARARIGAASGWMAAMQSAGNALGAIAAGAIASGASLSVLLVIALLATCALTVSHIRRLPLQPFDAAQRLAVTRPLVDLFISRALVYLGFYTLLNYLFFYVRNVLPSEFPVNASLASGICILIFTLLGALGAGIAAKPADRLDERLVVFVGGGVMALAVVLLAAFVALPFVPVAIAVTGVGWGIFLCADWAFACRTLPAGSLATTMAVWNLAVLAPQMLSPQVTTLVLRATGTIGSAGAPRVAFVLASLEILIGISWIWRLPQSTPGV